MKCSRHHIILHMVLQHLINARMQIIESKRQESRNEDFIQCQVVQEVG